MRCSVANLLPKGAILFPIALFVGDRSGGGAERLTSARDLRFCAASPAFAALP